MKFYKATNVPFFEPKDGQIFWLIVTSIGRTDDGRNFWLNGYARLADGKEECKFDVSSGFPVRIRGYSMLVSVIFSHLPETIFQVRYLGKDRTHDFEVYANDTMVYPGTGWTGYEEKVFERITGRWTS